MVETVTSEPLMLTKLCASKKNEFVVSATGMHRLACLFFTSRKKETCLLGGSDVKVLPRGLYRWPMSRVLGGGPTGRGMGVFSWARYLCAPTRCSKTQTRNLKIRPANPKAGKLISQNAFINKF